MMTDDELMKILFVLQLLRNRVDGKDKEYAEEMIGMLQKHLGVD